MTTTKEPKCSECRFWTRKDKFIGACSIMEMDTAGSESCGDFKPAHDTTKGENTTQTMEQFLTELADWFDADIRTREAECLPVSDERRERAAATRMWAERAKQHIPDKKRAAESRQRYLDTKEIARTEHKEPSGPADDGAIVITIEPCHRCGRVSERMALKHNVWQCEGGCKP